VEFYLYFSYENPASRRLSEELDIVVKAVN
jgi:hypothetical protein